MARSDGLPTPRSRGRRGGLLVSLVIAATGVAGSLATPGSCAAARAGASRTVALNDTGSLHLTSHHGFTLNEQGSATGSIGGTIYIHLHVASTNRVTAEVNIYPSGGSITGTASAAYRPSGAVASFAGALNILRGTGRYRHASGSGLSFTGTIRRTTDAVTVHVSGRMSV